MDGASVSKIPWNINSQPCNLALHLIARVQYPCKRGVFVVDIEGRIARIDAERHNQGLSIQQLADMCQLSASTVSRTLAGKTEPTDYTIHAMEESLGIADSPMDSLPEEQTIERYMKLQDSRIARLRAFYNRELAEKDRWIRFLCVLCLFLIVLSLALCFMMESPL